MLSFTAKEERSIFFPAKKREKYLFLHEKLSVYSSTIMAVQRAIEVTNITYRSIHHLAMTDITGVRRRHTAIISPSSLEPSKHVVVDSQKVVMLRPHGTSASEQ